MFQDRSAHERSQKLLVNEFYNLQQLWVASTYLFQIRRLVCVRTCESLVDEWMKRKSPC